MALSAKQHSTLSRLASKLGGQVHDVADELRDNHGRWMSGGAQGKPAAKGHSTAGLSKDAKKVLDAIHADKSATKTIKIAKLGEKTDMEPSRLHKALDELEKGSHAVSTRVGGKKGVYDAAYAYKGTKNAIIKPNQKSPAEKLAVKKQAADDKAKKAQDRVEAKVARDAAKAEKAKATAEAKAQKQAIKDQKLKEKSDRAAKREEKASSNHAIAEGKDLSSQSEKLIKSAKSYSNPCLKGSEEQIYARRLFGHIAATQGFEGKPLVVSEKQLNDLVKSGATETYRGFHGESSNKFAKDLRTSKQPFLSQYYVYGQGIYTSPEKSLATEYARVGGVGVLTRMALDKSAKIVDYDALTQMMEKSNFNDAGAFAALKGYDAIHCQAGEGINLIILNRTKLITTDKNMATFGNPK